MTFNYNIPSNNRELQQQSKRFSKPLHYNIPSNNRELQLILFLQYRMVIITYQVITGNYSFSDLI